MKKALATYLSNILWVYLYWDFEGLKTVNPKFLNRVIGTIEKSEIELINLGASETALLRIIKMCEQIVHIYHTDRLRLPEPYRTKIEKIIISTPHQ
jgi:hypothetical protein